MLKKHFLLLMLKTVYIFVKTVMHN